LTDKISAHNRIVAGTLAVAMAMAVEKKGWPGYGQPAGRNLWSMDTSGSTRKQFVTKPESSPELERPDPETGDPSDLQLEAFNFCRDAKTFKF